MTDLVASEIRRLHRKIAQLDRRVALANVPGKVASVDHEKRTLRLELGKDAQGQPILSPAVRWQEPGAGDFKVHAPPKVGEQMTLSSPSGTMGGGSMAVWGTYDRDNAAPSKASDAAVLQFGDASITAKDGGLTLAVGGVSLALSGAGPAFSGGKLTHDGKDVGATHVHSGVERGGARTDPPAN